jgi:hypothetical protein
MLPGKRKKGITSPLSRNGAARSVSDERNRIRDPAP